MLSPTCRKINYEYPQVPRDVPQIIGRLLPASGRCLKYTELIIFQNLEVNRLFLSQYLVMIIGLPFYQHFVGGLSVLSKLASEL